MINHCFCVSQYGDVVQANLRVTCRAVPIPIEEMNRPTTASSMAKSTHKPDAMTFGGHRPPNLEPKVSVKIRYHYNETLKSLPY